VDAITSHFKTDIAGGNGFAIARALKLAGYPETANEVVAATIAANPDAVVPADLLGLSDAGLELAAAKALADAGLDAPANAQLQAALEKDPNLHVPDELASPSRTAPGWRGFLSRWEPRLRTVAEAVILVLAATALALIIARSVRRVRSRLAIAPFTGGANAEAGPAMTAVVRENYGRLTKESGGHRLGLVSSSGEASLVPPKEVISASPQVGMIAALVGFVDRLIPSRTREVRGYLRPRDPRRGAGVTVTLARRYGKQFGEVTLWEAEYGPLAPQGEKDPAQPSYDRLGVPAAAWLMFEAGNRSVLERLRFWRKFRLLGTENWRSYAMFAVGAEDHARGQFAVAERRYLTALALDPQNHGAALNLASAQLALADNDKKLNENAKERLEQLRETLEDQPGDYTSDELWYRTRYNQASAELHPEFGTGAAARKAAVGLCAVLLMKLDRLSTPIRHRTSRKVRTFLEDVQPTALVTLASALRLDRRPPSTMPDTAKPVDEDVLREELWAFARSPHDHEAAARFDAKVTHAAIVEYVLDKLGPPDARTNYNLACYFTRVDYADPETKWSEAEDRLLAAVELGGSGVGERALVDASLPEYRDDDGRFERLKSAIERVTEPKPAAPPPAPAPAPAGKNPLERLVELLGG
jgi:hypothetical protein